MTKLKKEVKKVPAGKNDELTLTYTQFATDKERSELLAPEGHEFDNDALLEMLGFEKDGKGLKLVTEGHDFEIAPDGTIIRRNKDGKILTGKVASKEEER